MAKVWSIIKQKHQGFSVVEVLLAVTVFALFATAVIGAVIYGRSSTADSGDQTRANYLAEEGIEAVRNIRSAGYSNLTDGTFGLTQSGNTWTFSGSTDTNDIFTRSTTIASDGTGRKTVTSNVSWNGAGGSGQTSLVTQLTNWREALPKSWANPSQYGSRDTTGTIAGFKIDSAGSYAYLIRRSSTGPNFFVINISNPSNPTVAGSLTLTGTPTNINVSGNYAYISNSLGTAELQIVNITNPATPTLAGTFNAAGTTAGQGVFVVGTTVYLVKAADTSNEEFVVVNAANPASPTRTTGYSAANVSMNEVFVSGTTAYIATGSDTQEVLVINLASSPVLSLGTAINLPGTTDTTTIDGTGNTLAVGQGTAYYSINSTTALVPTVSGTLTLLGTVNDVTVDSTHGYVFAGTNYASGELQVINVNNAASPSILSSVNMVGTLSLTGVAYNTTYDVVPAASSSTTAEFVIFGPN